LLAQVPRWTKKLEATALALIQDKGVEHLGKPMMFFDVVELLNMLPITLISDDIVSPVLPAVSAGHSLL
jgi:hypothetical protein